MQIINFITQSKDESKKKKKSLAPCPGFKTQSFIINIPQTSERIHILSWSNEKKKKEESRWEHGF